MRAASGRSAAFASARRWRTKRSRPPDRRRRAARFRLDAEMLTKLERLAGLRFRDQAEVDALREEIRLANRIFEVNTEGVEPLYSIVEERIDCPLREDEPVIPDQKAVFANAPAHVEGFFVSPPANIPLPPNELFHSKKTPQ
ncbi:Glutamyl-tRNA(Gln) amidotransferase subunit C, mitochondrial [Aphelenchoides fujianensis]|nr:Glutamyl-tRNA(Gln) amidotransferase subunit C, mitochondrial [Aphelenchoides fujianensis]